MTGKARAGRKCRISTRSSSPNSRVWLKLQGSCVSCEQAEAFFGCRFTGTDRIVDERVCVTPFRLSERSGHVANWASIVDRLPAGWDDEQFPDCGVALSVVQKPGRRAAIATARKGGLDIIYCSDFGLHEETDTGRRYRAIDTSGSRGAARVRRLQVGSGVAAVVSTGMPVRSGRYCRVGDRVWPIRRSSWAYLRYRSGRSCAAGAGPIAKRRCRSCTSILKARMCTPGAATGQTRR